VAPSTRLMCTGGQVVSALQSRARGAMATSYEYDTASGQLRPARRFCS
jgi:hypothetical protein